MFTKIKVNDIFTANYNRKIDGRRVKKITDSYDPDLFGYLTVHKRDNGDLYIIDGQHRLAAARQLRFAEVPCLIIQGLTAEEEALKFIQLNKERKALTPLDYFKARCLAGDKDAIATNKIVEDAGFSFYGGPRKIKAVREIEIIYKKLGGTCLKSTLNLIEKTWPGQPAARNGLIIKMLAHYLHQNTGANRERMSYNLAQINPLNLIAGAKNPITGGFDLKLALKNLEMIYNKRYGSKTREA